MDAIDTERLSSNNECAICFEPHLRIATAYPCEHKSVCVACTVYLKQCPRCLKEVLLWGGTGSNHVIIQRMDGVFYRIDAESSTTIDYIKAQLQKMTGHPPDAQRLVWRAKLMDDGRTLGDYDIQSGSKIVIVLRLGGHL